VQVCTQVLSLPPGVVVNSASVAAGHLSSASIYPACFAPYLLTTACSDGHVHFWRCELTSPGEDAPLQSLKYVWKEWEMMIPKEINSSIHVPGIYIPCLFMLFTSCQTTAFCPHSNTRCKLDAQLFWRQDLCHHTHTQMIY